MVTYLRLVRGVGAALGLPEAKKPELSGFFMPEKQVSSKVLLNLGAGFTAGAGQAICSLERSGIQRNGKVH